MQGPQDQPVDQVAPAVSVNMGNSRDATALSFWQSYTTTLDFQGPSIQEGWHGHHFPRRRALFCIVFYCWTNVMVFLTAVIAEAIWPQSSPLDLLPLLRFMDDRTLQQVKKSHIDCITSIRDVFDNEVNFDCLYRDTPVGFIGVGIDLDAYDGPFELDWPVSCREAYISTLGRRTFDDLSFWDYYDNGDNSTTMLEDATWGKLTKMLRIAGDDADLEKSVDEMAFIVVYPRCALGVLVDFLPLVLDEGIFDLNQLVIDARNVTEQFTVIDEPSQGTSRIPAMLSQLISYCFEALKDLPFDTIHAWILRNRHGVAFCLLSYSVTLLYGMQLLTSMGSAFILTFVLRRLLPWPRDRVGNKEITFWRTFDMIVMICTFVEGYMAVPVWNHDNFAFGMCFDAIVVIAAYKYTNNFRVLNEYVFISVIRYLLTNELGFDWFVIPEDDDLVGASVMSWVSMIIPGSVVSTKLLNLYALCRAYPLWGMLKRNTESEHADVDIAGIDFTATHEKVE